MKKILFIEDNIDFREPVCEGLRHRGYAVTEADNGKEGIQEYLAAPYDLIITDIFMPEMDGMEIIEYFQGNKDMKIIVISGGSPEGIDLLSAARELGASRVMSKPVELQELVNAIEDVLGNG